MPTKLEFHKILLSDIKVDHERRQRRTRERVGELADSILRVGLIHPLVVARNEDGSIELVAGEQRFEAIKFLHKQGLWKHGDQVPVQYLEELSPFERQVVELEENVRRVDLNWKDRCGAILQYYELRLLDSPEISHEDVAKATGWSRKYISDMLEIGRALRSNNPQVHACETQDAARNLMARQTERKLDAEIEDLIQGVEITEGPLAESEALISRMSQDPAAVRFEQTGTPVFAPLEERPYRDAKFDITHESFLDFALSYSGPKFNFLHCDFPYGINIHSSEQAGRDVYEVFKDTEDVFFELLGTLLEARDRIMASSAHIMFWFSMKHYQIISESFEREGFIVNPRPLIWYKSDKRGILPDSTRGPRRVYETALLISRGDRKIIRAVPDCCSYPSGDKSEHFTQKPYPVLEHFFSMLVDESSLVLDPTCGSGTSIHAADLMGAKVVRGMDIDENNVRKAVNGLNISRMGRVEYGDDLAEGDLEDASD